MMKAYIGTKTLNAEPMTRGEYNKLRGWDLPEDENPNDEGYVVEYTDGGVPNLDGFEGYVSWSPKDIFEKSYMFIEGLNFGLAIEAMRIGKKVTRKGWNGNKIPPLTPPFPEHTPTQRMEIVGDYGYLVGSKGSIAIFDAELKERLRGKENFTEGSGGYFIVSFYENNKNTSQVNLRLHQLLFDCPDNLVVDHINGNILDNRSENIRFVTDQQNNINRRKSSGNYKGVSFDSSRNKFISSIQVNGNTAHIGRFKNEIEAAEAYDDKAYEIFGEYVRLNFPDRNLKPRMYLYYVPANAYPATTEIAKKEWGDNPVPYGAYIAMKTAQNNVVPWLASQTDKLALDWQIID